MDPDTATDDADDDTRDHDGRFRPGVSGNPHGRPPGSSRALHLTRVLAEAGIVAVVVRDRPRQPRSPPARRLRALAA